jgi:transposase
MPRCDTEAMNLHLAEIATQIAPGAHAALLLDQAGWHLSGSLNVPPNITLIRLPAKCPELNPQENVWQFMRDNWLSNRIFKSFQDILDHCCDAWNKLVDQPWKIISIGMRDWPTGHDQRVSVLVVRSFSARSTCSEPFKSSEGVKPFHALVLRAAS